MSKKLLIFISIFNISFSYSFIINIINSLNDFNKHNRNAITSRYKNIIKKYNNNKNITKSSNIKEKEEAFSQIAGELPIEVKEIIEFIDNPEKFNKLGIARPKGILLVGPPGTGKTSIARQIAKISNAKFLSKSGSSFINLYVGNGPRRVRKLFKEAKKEIGPVIIFIDEIDAVAAKRTGSSNSKEYNNTLNELLNQMDGFEQNDNITVIGATNYAQYLDEAILRPGRFDRKIYIGLPNQKNRRQILEFYCKKITCDLKNIDFEKLSKITEGFSGAELKNLVNEAAIRASRQNKNIVTQQDFNLALKDL